MSSLRSELLFLSGIILHQAFLLTAKVGCSRSGFDEIVITSEESIYAFESDNHTFSPLVQDVIGTPIDGSAPPTNPSAIFPD